MLEADIFTYRSVEMLLASPLLFTSHPAIPPWGTIKYKFPKFFLVTFYGLKVSNLIGDENSEQHSANTLGIRVLPSTYELRKIYSLAHVECWGGVSQGELCSSLGVRTTVQEYPVVTCIKTWPPWELQWFRNETLDCAVKVVDAVSLGKNGNCIGLR